MRVSRTGIEAVGRLLRRHGLQAKRGADADRLIVQSNPTDQLGEVCKAAGLWWFRASRNGEWIVVTDADELLGTVKKALRNVQSPLDPRKQTA